MLGGLLRAVPWFLPGALLLGLTALLLARPLGRRWGLAPGVAGGLVAAVGLPLLAALAPIPESSASTGCSWSLPTLESLTRLSASSLNVVAFVPLGALIMRTRRPAALLGAAAFLPFVIEAAQRLIPGLGRSCQAEDLVTNLAGLAAGALLGAGARRAGLV